MPTITKSEAKQMGIPKKNLQTILIKKDSKKWLKDHNFVNSNYRLTKNERSSQVLVTQAKIFTKFSN